MHNIVPYKQHAGTPPFVACSHIQPGSPGHATCHTFVGTLAGFLGFYSGMNTKIVQSILAAALMMAIKEKLTAGTRAILETPRPSPQVLQQQAKAVVTGVK